MRTSKNAPPKAFAPAEDEAAESIATTSALTLAVMCPLCLADRVIDPVLLHAEMKCSSGSDACVVCQSCAARWAPLMASVDTDNEETSANATTATCPCCAQAMNMQCEFQLLAAMHAPPRALRNTRVGSTSLVPFDVAESLAAWRVAQRSATRDAHGNRREENANTTTTTTSATDPPLCGVCEEAGAALMCRQCAFCLCDGCRAATHTKGGFRQHEVLPVGEVIRQQQLARESSSECGIAPGAESKTESGRQPVRKCATHPEQSLDLYCRTCEACVCVSCCFGAGAHRNDDVAPIAEVAVQAREVIRGMAERTAKVAAEAAATRERLEVLAPAYCRLVDTTEGRIRAAFEQLRAALAEREERLIDRLRSASTGVRDGVSAQASLTARVSAAMQHCGASLESLSQVKGNVALMESLPVARRSASALHALGTRLSTSAARAQARFSTRMEQSADGVPLSTLDAGHLVSFKLFPADVGDGDSDAVVAEYAELLGSIGEVRAQSSYPIPGDTVPTPARAESADACQPQCASGAAARRSSLRLANEEVSSNGDSQQNAHETCAGVGFSVIGGTVTGGLTTEVPAPRLQPPTCPGAVGQDVVEQEQEPGREERPPLACTGSAFVLPPPPQRVPLPALATLPLEFRYRRTEVHTFSRGRSSHIITADKSTGVGSETVLASNAPHSVWPSFNLCTRTGPLSSLSKNGSAPSAGSKLLLDFSAGEPTAKASAGNVVARFSNCSPDGGDVSLRHSAFGLHEPALKASRTEPATAVDASAVDSSVLFMMASTAHSAKGDDAPPVKLSELGLKLRI